MNPLSRTTLCLSLSLAVLPVAGAHAASQKLTRASSSGTKLAVDSRQAIRASWLEHRGSAKHPRVALVEATAAAGHSTFAKARARIEIARAGSTDWASYGHGGEVVVWNRPTGVWSSIVQPDGTHTPRRLLSTPGASTTLPAVAANTAGDAVACWWQRRGSRRGLGSPRCAIRRAGSERFATARTLGGHQPQPPRLEPQVADDGQLLLTSELDREHILVAQGSLSHGWGASTILTPDPLHKFVIDYNEKPFGTIYTAAIAPGGGAIVADVQNGPAADGGFDHTVHTVRVSVRGVVSEPQRLGEIVSGTSGFNTPALAGLEDGSSMLAFPDEPDMLVTRAPAGRAAPFPMPVSAGTAYADDADPDIASGPRGTAALTWARESDSDSDSGFASASIVRLARYDGSKWSAPIDVSSPRQYAEYPSVAINDSGATALVWGDGNGVRATIVR